jgi:hypothetical protein
MDRIAALLRRRVGGVEVLWIAVAAVGVLAVVAWRTRGSAAADVAGDAAAAATATSASTDSIYEPLTGMSSGVPSVSTVTAVVPAQSVTPDDAQPSISSDSEWLSRGVAHLLTVGYSGGEAQEALQTYLAGASMSTRQGTMRDLVIAELGLPPAPPDISAPAAAATPAAPTAAETRAATAAAQAAEYEGQYVRNANTGGVLRVSGGHLYPVTLREFEAIRPDFVNLPASSPIFDLQV